MTLLVLANDHDPDGDVLSIESTTRPSHGTLVNHGASLSYVSDPEFSGTDTFTYTVSDGRGGSDTAQVTVVVGTVNDLPLAQDDSAATAEDTLVVIAVLANDTESRRRLLDCRVNLGAAERHGPQYPDRIVLRSE